MGSDYFRLGKQIENQIVFTLLHYLKTNFFCIGNEYRSIIMNRRTGFNSTEMKFKKKNDFCKFFFLILKSLFVDNLLWNLRIGPC